MLKNQQPNGLVAEYVKLFDAVKKWYAGNKGTIDSYVGSSGTYADRLQLTLFHMIYAAGFVGFYCKEIDRYSNNPECPTLALFSPEKSVRDSVRIDVQEY